MKNFLKKLHIVPNQSDTVERSNSLKGLSSWLHSVTNKQGASTSPSSNETQSDDRMESSDHSVNLSGVGADIGQEGGSGNSRDPDVEEEYQIQLALELSAREDPEAVQIEAIKQISLGSCSVDNTPAEVVAYRYWNYNALGYDDKVMDGFYDLYGVLNESTYARMPSLIDLQGTPISDTVTWEAILVNRSGDSNLLKLEHKAVEIAVKSRSDPLVCQERSLVRSLAILVSDYMGGPVANPESMLREWRSLDCQLKAMIGSMVLPLGSLTIGLARHRALLFKVLADSVGIPCRLVKGKQYTGSADVAMIFVKIDDGREYIVDLMADPGTLIPADIAGILIGGGSSQVGSSSIRETISFEEQIEKMVKDKNKEYINNVTNVKSAEGDPLGIRKPPRVRELPQKPNFSHARSPSWTEGVTLPAAQRMKVRDVSQYMIDAAEENPQLAQKLHDVLLESGVIAPPNLFGEINPNISRQINQDAKSGQDGHKKSGFLPPLPNHNPKGAKQNAGILGSHLPNQQQEETGQLDISPVKYAKNVPPVAAAAAAAAAVVASSMVVAVSKSTTEPSVEFPVAAAATATAAAMMATTAAVNKQTDEQLHGNGENRREPDALEHKSDGEKVSDKSTGGDSTKSDVTMDDVAADYEIQWEEITLGDRIGLGSYGEVYHGDWHGTEVAVKRFLDQDISGESLEEFKSEIRIMKKVRHPNVVLFMGAITRVPNLSIVTEFLPRGSLYRLLHRPNNQLDERRRLRMALDAARGMNYLHNCNPVIVHRDLKSPNLLVDKNWVVKVCDFGLSRMKNSTYLSSRSTAGTAEWMAPEVLRNEPSNEKCDVYSFGVILWELCTLQQPWGGMNPMQVVGAVGFQHRRLDIPPDMDPAVADIILQCWQTDAKLRPTFAQIMAALKPLQKPIVSSQVPRPAGASSSGRR